eukprot:gene5262-18497_t
MKYEMAWLYNARALYDGAERMMQRHVVDEMSSEVASMLADIYGAAAANTKFELLCRKVMAEAEAMHGKPLPSGNLGTRTRSLDWACPIVSSAAMLA